MSLVYERGLRETAFPFWVERCAGQINGALAQLNTERAARPADWWFGERISHADIVVGAVLRFLSEALAGAIDLRRHTALTAHSARCEALPVFQTVSQPFVLTPAP